MLENFNICLLFQTWRELAAIFYWFWRLDNRFDSEQNELLQFPPFSLWINVEGCRQGHLYKPWLDLNCLLCLSQLTLDQASSLLFTPAVSMTSINKNINTFPKYTQYLPVYWDSLTPVGFIVGFNNVSLWLMSISASHSHHMCVNADCSLLHMAPDVEKYTQRYLKQRSIDDMEWTPGALILTTDADWFVKLYTADCFVQQEGCRKGLI